MRFSLFPPALLLLFLFLSHEVCQAQRASSARNAPPPPQRVPDPLPDWVTLPVKPTIYPPDARPREFDMTLPWKIAFQPIPPPTLATTEDQVIVLPDINYSINEAKILLGPPESGIVVVAGNIETFFSGRKKEDGVTVFVLASLKHGKAVTKTFPTEVKAFDISPNGKFLAVTIQPATNRSAKMNHLLILRLDDGSFDAVAHYTPFDDAPSTRPTDNVGISDVFWLNNQNLFVTSERGLGVQLNLTTHTIGFGIIPESQFFASPFFLTPDRKYLVTRQRKRLDDPSVAHLGYPAIAMAIFDAADGKQLGYLRLSQTTGGQYLSTETPATGIQTNTANDTANLDSMYAFFGFSPSGRLLACGGPFNQLFVWDFFRGQLLGIESAQSASQGVWINNRYFFSVGFDKHRLIDAKDMEVCALYDRQCPILCYTVLGDKLLYLTGNDAFRPTELSLVYSQAIPPSMDEFREQSARRKERLMGPGDKVSLEFNLRQGAGFRSQIEQHFRSICVKNGWKVVPPGDSEYRIEAYISEPEEEITLSLTQYSVISLATQKYRPYSVGYVVYQGNQIILHYNSRIVPKGVYSSAEEFNRLLPEEMRVKPDWFLDVSLPETITRGDMEKAKSNATVTTKGIVFE